MFYIIGILKNGVLNSHTEGYRVYETGSKTYKDIPAAHLINALINKKLTLENAKYDEKVGGIVGTQGALSRYPMLDAGTGRLLGTQGVSDFKGYTSSGQFAPIIVLNKNIELDEYTTVNWRGNEQLVSASMLIRQGNQAGLANMKVVEKPKGVYNISAISGVIRTVGEVLKYVEKEFDTPNTENLCNKWLVRVLHKGDKYGLHNKLVHKEDKPLVEFYAKEKAENFPNKAQFVARYYIDTLLEDTVNLGICLYGEVPFWSIDAENYKKIRIWLYKIAKEEKIPNCNNWMLESALRSKVEEAEGDIGKMRKDVANIVETIANYGGLNSFSLGDIKGSDKFIAQITKEILDYLTSHTNAKYVTK